jgi:hypothetical protein
MENSPKKEKRIVLTEEEKKEVLDAVEILNAKDGDALAGGLFVKVVAGFSKAAAA